MKKQTLALLLALICLLALAGCGNNGDAEAEKPKDGDNVTFAAVASADAPDSVQQLAKQCAGKTETMLLREGDGFYILLSTAEGAGSDIEKITVVENSDATLISVALKNAADEAEGPRIYRVEKMSFEDGVIFQSAAQPAIEEETNDKNGDTAGNENALDGSAITISIAAPKEGDVLTGSSLDVKGAVTGNVKKVVCQLVDGDGHELGEAEALVADISHEYSAKLSYTLDDDGNRDGDVILRVYSENESGVMLAEEKVTLKLK